MLGVLPFGEDPDLSGTAGTAVPQHLPPWDNIIIARIFLGNCYCWGWWSQIVRNLIIFTKQGSKLPLSQVSGVTGSLKPHITRVTCTSCQCIGDIGSLKLKACCSVDIKWSNFHFKDFDGSFRCVTVASSYGHSKVASYLREMLAQNNEEKEEWDFAEYEDKFCGSFTPLVFFLGSFILLKVFCVTVLHDWRFFDGSFTST